MTRPDGIHHLALSTKDMKAQLQFFTDVIGMELVALSGCTASKAPGTRSCASTGGAFSFVYMPEMERIAAVPGVTHALHQGAPSAGGSMQHLALRVDSPDDVLAMRDRVRTHGIQVFGQIEHGLCTSIYFAGPEGLNLEVACQGAFEPDDWFDPEVVSRCGISEDELRRMRAPAPFARPKSLCRSRPPIRRNRVSGIRTKSMRAW